MRKRGTSVDVARPFGAAAQKLAARNVERRATSSERPDVGMPPICSINTSEVAAGLDALPSHWLRHFSPHSVSAASLVATYRGLKGWGRTLFAIHRDNRGRGRLLFAPQGLGPNGCVLRRTPIFAWALLELLERHPSLPAVALPLNCRDKPTYWYPDGPQPQGSYEKATTATSKDGKPALAFSYTTGHTFSDVPLPDATFFGLPYARIPPWDQWLKTTAHAPTSSWEAKRDQILWVGTTGVGNGKLGFSSHPLRAKFARCGPAAFGKRLAIRGVAKEAIDRLAWKCPPGACDDFPPAQWIDLAEQCRYRIILHLPGVSDWLEHFKHQLSCGSLSVYVTEEREANRRDLRREGEFRPPLRAPAFEHFDWWAPLLREGEHYVHVRVKRRAKQAEICEAVSAALAEVEATPGKARCIAERGQQLARALTMERVYAYMAGVVTAAAAIQQPEIVRAAAARGSVVTKRNWLRHASASTRPWLEHIFLPWHNATPPRGERAGGGARAATGSTFAR